jgi:hypothetical protein
MRTRQELKKTLKQLLEHAVEPSTLRRYRAMARRYQVFCNQHAMRLDDEHAIALFVAHLSATNKSVHGALAALSFVFGPLYPGFKAARQSLLVVRAARGVQKQNAAPARRVDALEEDDLRLLQRCPNKYDYTLFRCLLYVGFFNLFRLGDLCPDVGRNGDERKLIRRDSVTLNTAHASLVLPYHKGDRQWQSTLILVMSRKGHRANPLVALADFLAGRDKAFPNRPELFLTANGTPPNRRWFLKRLAQLDMRGRWIRGHSMRSGGATWLAAKGTSEATIQRLGRWASDAWTVYIRKHPALIALLEQSRHKRTR